MKCLHSADQDGETLRASRSGPPRPLKNSLQKFVRPRFEPGTGLLAKLLTEANIDGSDQLFPNAPPPVVARAHSEPGWRSCRLLSRDDHASTLPIYGQLAAK